MYRLWVLTVLCAYSIPHVTSVKGQDFSGSNRLSQSDVERIIRRIELRSNLFRSSLDLALAKNRHNSTRENYVNSFIKDFSEQTKRLRDHFDQRSLVTSDVQAVLDRAAPIDEFMTRNRLSSEAQNDWTKLRNKLDRLAIAYRIRWHWNSYGSDDPPAFNSPAADNKSTKGCQPVVVPNQPRPDKQPILRR